MNNNYDRDMDLEVVANVKLILLQSGEQIVADVEESVDGKTLTLKEPRGIVLQSSQEDGETVSSTISHGEWFPLSKDRTITIASNYVVAITEPLESLATSYVRYIEQNG
jgi:hypothetical protein